MNLTEYDRLTGSVVRWKKRKRSTIYLLIVFLTFL
jgi:hypothetical protein